MMVKVNAGFVLRGEMLGAGFAGGMICVRVVGLRVCAV